MLYKRPFMGRDFHYIPSIWEKLGTYHYHHTALLVQYNLYYHVLVIYVTLNPIFIFTLVAINHEVASMFSGSNCAACEQLTSNRELTSRVTQSIPTCEITSNIAKTSCSFFG